jgi:hypothetical protein
VGASTAFDGVSTPLSGATIVASNGLIHDQMLAVVREPVSGQV